MSSTLYIVSIKHFLTIYIGDPPKIALTFPISSLSEVKWGGLRGKARDDHADPARPGLREVRGEVADGEVPGAREQSV